MPASSYYIDNTAAAWGLGYEPKGEGESWFTQGEVVIPAALPIEALPKQPWDSYKPDFWAGIQCFSQKPLWNLPYFWAGTGWQEGMPPLAYTYTTITMQPVANNARHNQLYTTAAPTAGIYTGTSEGSNP